jgi:hypothetical protein
MAARMVISRSRALIRASSRLATFEQAMTSNSDTAPIPTYTIGRNGSNSAATSGSALKRNGSG